MNNEPDDVKHEHSQLSDEMQHFAADLSRLRPRDDRLDRERLAFLAGQALVSPAPIRIAKLLGLPLESRVWPAAFASMTAIAAALLLALIMRPEGTDGRPSNARIHVYNDAPQLAIERREDSSVLRALDAYGTDIESRLAIRERNQTDDGMPATRDIERKVPVLTANAWHQVIHETESTQPSPHDASGLSQNQGVNS